MYLHYLFNSYSFFFNSCYWLPQKKVKSQLYPSQVVKEKYKLSHRVFQYNPLIDTSVVYLHIGQWTQNGKPEIKTCYMFIRFSNQGAAFISNFDEIKFTDKEYNNMLTGGQFYCYKVENNTLILESYEHHLKIFQYWYGHISDSEINFYKEKGRTFGTGRGELKLTFKKVTTNLTTRVKFPK